MHVKKWIALALATVMAAGLLAACGGPGSSAGITLKPAKIEALLQERGVDAGVTADRTLSDAAEAAARTLAAGSFDEAGAMDVTELVAQEAGMALLLCEISSDAPYWGDSPLRYANRYQERAADLLDDLGDGAYKIAAARFTTQDKVECVLYAVAAA